MSSRHLYAGLFLIANLIPTDVVARGLAIEEVVVTAQKREQNAMDVPVTIDTFSGKDLENTGALVIEDIAAYIPGFDTGQGITQNTVKIRGVENSNVSSGLDASVASFFDEVYLPTAAITVAFSDLAQIEVLKGPQGTLFGRNAAMGVVNMIPNSPNMEETEAFVVGKLGNQGIQRYEAMYNWPVNDNIAIRMNVLSNRKDSPVSNSAGPKTAGAPISSIDPREANSRSARIAVKWEFSDRLAMQLAYDYDKVDNGAQANFGLGPNSDYTNVADNKLGQDAFDPGESRDMYSIIGKLWYDISDSLTLKLITSYRPYETDNRQDDDGTSSEIYLDTNNVYDSDIFYNELQMNWNTDFATYVFGLNYSEEETYQFTTATASKELVAIAVQQEAGSDDPITLALIQQALDQSDPFTTESLTNTGEFKNYGAYVDGDFTITDWLSILAGLRYSVDKKAFTWFTPANPYPVAQVGGNLIFAVTDGVESGSESWSDFTGRLVANAQISEGSMAFITYSTGYKSGGFDSLSVFTKDEPLDPEIVTNYEIGVKGDFLERSVRMQLAYFNMTIDGRQEVVQSLEPGSSAARPILVNADEDIEGFELTIDYLPFDDLRFGAVFTMRDNERAREPYFDNEGDLRSNENVGSTAPKDYTITADWEMPWRMANGGFFLHADYIFKDNIARDTEDHRPIFNTFPGYAEDTKLINLRISWVGDSGYEVSIWGQNLDNDDSFANGNGVPNGLISGITGDYVTQVQSPKTFGVDVKWTL